VGAVSTAVPAMYVVTTVDTVTRISTHQQSGKPQSFRLAVGRSGPEPENALPAMMSVFRLQGEHRYAARPAS